MTALRGPAVLDGVLVPDAVVVWDGALLQHAGPAAATDVAADPLPPGATLLPGLVDLHCHGAVGGDFADRDAAHGAAAAAHHLAHGTTSLLASLVSQARDATTQAVAAAAGLGAPVEGLHLEGPYLSVDRRGAHDPALLRDPDAGELGEWLDAGRGRVATVTLAPERPGCERAVEQLLAAGVLPALGHTDADEGTATSFLRQVAASGRRALVTHLFNGMRPWHHRDAGPVAAALAAAGRGEAVVELIADGVHLDDASVRSVLDLVGPGSVALVTDAMAATGHPDGAYRLGTLDVEVRDGVARLAGGGSIAGGTTRLLDVVRRLVLDVGLPLADVVTAASATPAAVLGRPDLGVLAAGRRADAVVVDAGLRPLAVLRAGRWVSGSPA